jgi:RNA recognition motif-containing protein
MRDQDGTSKGCAFIKFKQKEEALLAIRFINGNVYIMGSDKPIEVRFAENIKGGKGKPTTTPTMPVIDTTPKVLTTPAMNPMMVTNNLF